MITELLKSIQSVDTAEENDAAISTLHIALDITGDDETHILFPEINRVSDLVIAWETINVILE